MAHALPNAARHPTRVPARHRFRQHDNAAQNIYVHSIHLLRVQRRPALYRFVEKRAAIQFERVHQFVKGRIARRRLEFCRIGPHLQFWSKPDFVRVHAEEISERAAQIVKRVA